MRFRSALVSALILVGCSSSDVAPSTSMENVVTMRGDTLDIVQSEAGVVKMRFSTPLVEEYAHAPEPYQEFGRGIDLKVYDTLGAVERSIRSNYALYWKTLDRWDLKGDVVARNAVGDMMETQQLYWSQKTQMVWSNVQTRFTREGDPMMGSGFEARQDFSEWKLRNGRGTQSVVFEPKRDTL